MPCGKNNLHITLEHLPCGKLYQLLYVIALWQKLNSSVYRLMFSLFKVITGVDLLSINNNEDQKMDAGIENVQQQEERSTNVVFDDSEQELETNSSEIANLENTDAIIPKTALLRGLLRSHGLDCLRLTNPIPEKIRLDLIHEAASLQRDSSRIKSFSDIELQDLAIFLSLVGKEKDNALLKLGRTEIAFELQKREERESQLRSTERQSSPPCKVPDKKHIAAFSTLRITDEKIKDLIKNGTRPSPDLFKLPGRLNQHGLPSSDFTRYLVVTREMVTELNVRPKAITMAKAAVARLNTLLHNDRKRATIPSSYLIVPITTFQVEAKNLAKEMMCLVVQNIKHYFPNKRQKVIRRLQMEIKARGLITSFHLTACAERLQDNETMDFNLMRLLVQDLHKAIGGLHHMVYMHENFY